MRREILRPKLWHISTYIMEPCNCNFCNQSGLAPRMREILLTVAKNDRRLANEIIHLASLENHDELKKCFASMRRILLNENNHAK